LLALSLTLTDPVLDPFAVGLNATLILQLASAARLAPQVVVETAKSPVDEIEIPVSALAVLLVKVNALAALLVPTV